MGIYISDSIHGLTRLTEYEKNIIASVGFNRLHDIYQNSTVYLTYPSNRTKRFEHSIGTMRLCSEMFFNSITNTPQNVLEAFYNMYKSALLDIQKSAQKNTNYQTFIYRIHSSLPNIALDNFEKSLIPRNIDSKYEIIHAILIQSIRVASLLHDIGHPPYSHVVERAMKSAFSDSVVENSIKELQQRDLLIEYTKNRKQLHEVMGDEISRSILMGILDKNHDRKSPDTIMYEILILEVVLRMFNNVGVFSYLHKLIDNSLDGDRLDYVTRDPANSGMNIGSIDYSRIIMDMRIIIKNNVPYFCVPLKATNAVEDFLKRRYDLYKNIVFHHRVIKTDYLMEHMVRNLIIKHFNNAHVLINMPSESIPFNISGLWAPLGQTAISVKDCILSQWNDSWLITVLKKIYYEQYYNVTANNKSEYIISKQFAELLNNERNYITLIKRSEDFKIVDNGFCETVSLSETNLRNKIKKLERKSKNFSVPESSLKSKIWADGDGFLDMIKTLLDLSNINQRNDNNIFALAWLLHNKTSLEITDLEIKTEEIVYDACCKHLSGFNYLNSIVVFKEIPPGVKSQEDIYFYDSHNSDQIYALDDVSSIVRTLRTENLFRPVFYLYILVDNNRSGVLQKKEVLLSEIGKALGIAIVKRLENNLDELIENLI